MRALLLVTGLALLPSALWGQERGSDSDHRFWLGPQIALVTSSPENFSASRCTWNSHVLGVDGGGFIRDRVFATAGVSRVFEGRGDCVIQLDPWDNPLPPPPEGTWTRDFYGPDESVLGNDYVMARLQLGIELARSVTGTSASVAVGPGWIPSKDLVGMVASGKAGVPLFSPALFAMFRVDVEWMRVPYLAETREYVDGVVVQSTVRSPSDDSLAAAFGLGLEYRFGHR